MSNQQEVNQIGAYLLDYKETIAVAESVTSGLLQATFSYGDFASQFFQGGITTYNVGQKAKHLDVEPIHALAVNAVSEKVAADMASGVCKMFHCDWGIGVTGYATPVPEKSIHELFACYAFCFHGQIVHSKKVKAQKMRADYVQQFYVSIIVKEFLARLASVR